MSDHQAIFDAIIAENRSGLQEIVHVLKTSAMRRGLDVRHGVRVQVSLLKCTYCVCTAKEEPPFIVKQNR